MVACAGAPACCRQLLWCSSVVDNIHACKMVLRHSIALQFMMPLCYLQAARQCFEPCRSPRTKHLA